MNQRVEVIDDNFKTNPKFANDKELYAVAKYHYVDSGSNTKVFYIVGDKPDQLDCSFLCYFGPKQLKFI